MKVLDIHARCISQSAELSHQQADYTISPLKVISILNAAQVSFILIGSHGLGGWVNKPRASQDVDVIVAPRHQKKATAALTRAFPHLQPEDHEMAIRLRDPKSGRTVIDLIKRKEALYRKAFKHTHMIRFAKQRFRVPSLEMALTMKFSGMVSPLRDLAAMYQDAHDFIRMVKSNPAIDSDTLAQLGELVYGGGGKGLVEMVRKVRAGEKLVL